MRRILEAKLKKKKKKKKKKIKKEKKKKKKKKKRTNKQKTGRVVLLTFTNPRTHRQIIQSKNYRKNGYAHSNFQRVIITPLVGLV